MMTAAFVFPGQGSQAVGMGKALAETFLQARAVFDEVDTALGEKLTATMWDGPADRLTLTENAQPALMAVSVAVMRVLEAEAGIDLARDAKFVAGHSLGEYSALAAAGAFSVTDAAKLLRLNWMWRKKSRWRRRKARSARPPMTTAADRSWCRATNPQWSARSRSPRPKARGGR
jgi:malonyl CoA-acyl carrier protein transacylase